MEKRERTVWGAEDMPLWYRDAIIYELHVRAFHDFDGDGIGDFRGLSAKLDYLQDLGVTAIWLLPFCSSPLRDDGYDTSDYTGLHPHYGTMKDFRKFLKEAHRRGLRVITEMVLNHTSNEHPWFQKARRAKPGSSARDFYVWSDNPDRYKDARIIFKDFETSNWTWDPVAQAYYWHRFYSHQPDLNYDNPQVRKAMLRNIDFWMDLGVDGLRLDAIPYLYEREGTNCENLPETFEFIREVRSHVDKKYRNRMLLAEANQWPEDAVEYFGRGDMCHMAFHFPVMPRLFMAVRMEDRFPILDILDQTPTIPESCQWALFLRNHDELTLEMVTDEERDYMYRVYAHETQMRVNLGIRRRLAPLLENNRRRIEFMNGLLFSLPGTPVIYYGDEIGMGDNIYLGDRNGVRTPMQWRGGRNAGFSDANPQKLFLPVIIDPEYHYESVNAENQQNNPHSLLWWMKRLISMRKNYRAFGQGSIEFLYPENHKVLVFTRRYGDEIILVAANLSRFVQCVELDLRQFAGMVPVELFGHTEFPPIGQLPYFITIGPHMFYWFSLEPRVVADDLRKETTGFAALSVSGPWESVFSEKHRPSFENILPHYFLNRRWFGGKARKITRIAITETMPLPFGRQLSYIIIVNVGYVDGEPERYVLTVTCASGERAEEIKRDSPGAVIAQIAMNSRAESGILYEAILEREFCEKILSLLRGRKKVKGRSGEIEATFFRSIRRHGTAVSDDTLEPSLLKAEQSNTSIMYGNRYILKFFRKLEEGINPDFEIGSVLTRKGFENIPLTAGCLDYRASPKRPPFTMAILQEFIPNEGDAWRYTLDTLGAFFENVLAVNAERAAISPPDIPIIELAGNELPEELHELMGAYYESVRLLGRRTAELHLSLAGIADDPKFTPEPFSKLYQRSLYQSMRKSAIKTFQTLRMNVKRIPEQYREESEMLSDKIDDILGHYKSILEKKIGSVRTRVHGDYHLGQVLYTGKDFIIIDFEGEPARSLSERQIKRSPFRDVAGMVRSFHYAAYSALMQQGTIRGEDIPVLEPWAELWYKYVTGAFLRAYFETAGDASFVPEDKEELKVLFGVLLLEKAVYELGYELNNRPDWVIIPIRGINHILGV